MELLAYGPPCVCVVPNCACVPPNTKEYSKDPRIAQGDGNSSGEVKLFPRSGAKALVNSELAMETLDARKARYFASGDSLRVRRVALDCIPGTTRKHSEGGAWITQPTWNRKVKGKIACCGSAPKEASGLLSCESATSLRRGE